MYVKRERSPEAIKRSAKKVARKKRLEKKELKLAEIEESGLRPTLATKPKQRISHEAYLKELKNIPHSKEYVLLSKFKLYTPNCIAQYQHKKCGTKFMAKCKDFELKKSLCPKCYSENISSTTIETL